VREVIPTAAIGCGRAQALPRGTALPGLGDLSVPAPGSGTTTWAELLAMGATDACVVLHHGRVVWETLAPHVDPSLPHIVFSVTKSVTGALAGCLVADGMLDPESPVTSYVPEVAASAYGDARVRHLLDMTVSSAFVEDYTATEGDYVRYRRATGWIPAEGAAPGDLLSFLATMPRGAEPHGHRFTYLSPNSDLLGIVLERAAGTRWSDLVAARIWQPMGAGGPADVTLDRLGAPRAAGGLSATLADLARFAEVMRCGGQAADVRQVIPAAWVADIFTAGDPAAWARGSMSGLYVGGRYRTQWYRTPEPATALAAMGIHGQWLWIDPGAGVSVVRLASQPQPVNEVHDLAFVAALARVTDALAAGEVGARG
jgi:CubicO group peptidase (beta-lactamase class C family)